MNIQLSFAALILAVSPLCPFAAGTETESTRALSPLQSEERDIVFLTPEGYPLKGRLSYPREKKSSYPSVVLIPGSGPSDMDLWLPGNSGSLRSTNGQPVSLFVQLRDVFLDAGYVVLRFNKRGYGKFPDDIAFDKNGQPIWANPISVTGTYPNLTSDAKRALSFLRNQPQIQADQVHMLGISEGTAIVRDIAGQDNHLAGIFLLSSVARNLRDSLYFQYVTKYLDIAKDLVDSDHDGILSRNEIARFEPDEFPFSVSDIDLDGDGLATLKELEGLLIDRFNQLISEFTTKDPFKDYYRERFSSSPDYSTVIPKIKGRVLMIQGEADVQCPLPEALLLAKKFRDNHAVSFEFKTFPGLGHGLSENIGKNGLINTIGPIDSRALNFLGAYLKTHPLPIDSR